MALDKQMDLFQEGGMIDEGGTKDPVSGNDVPTGSLQKEVRDDIPAQLSEGEFVMPADVVRFHGLDKMMALRDEAKAGLRRMEDMGQMGNSEEATIPDGIPFNMDDLELEDEPMEMQVGGFVPSAPTFTPGNMQQSQFANYTPQYTPYQMPQYTAPTYTGYQAPQQAFTPTAPTQAPSFTEFVRPKTATYVDSQGNEIQIPIGEDGTPLIPVPPGYTLKSDTPATTDPTPDPTQQQQQQQATMQEREDDPSDKPDTSVGGGVAAFGGIAYDLAYESSQKTAPGLLGMLTSKTDRVVLTNPAGKTATMSKDLYNSLKKGRNTEFTQQTLNRLFDATEAANTQITQSPGYEKSFFGDNSKELEAAAAETIYKDLGLEYKGQPLSEALIIQEDAAVEKERFERAAGVPTTGVETARVTGEAAGKTISQTAEEFRADEARRAGLAGMPTADQLAGSDVIDERIIQTANALMARDSTISPDDAMRAAFLGETQGIDAARTYLASPKDGGIIDAAFAGSTLSRADDAAPSGVAASIARSQRTKTATPVKDAPIYREPDPSSDILPGEPGSDIAPTLNREEVDRQTQNYRNKGYSASVARQNAKNKVAADNAAKQQARDRGESEEHISKTSAVTDSSGKPVTHTSKVTGKTTVVTNEPEKDDPDPSKIVCTEMYRQTQLDDWKQAIKIWGVHQKKYLTPYHEKGYHWLFKPWVKGMRKSVILTFVGAYLAKARTQHLRHILTHGKAKDDIVGNIWCKIVHPLTYIAGRTKEWLKL